MTEGIPHILATLIGLAVVGLLYHVVRVEITEIARHVNYANIGVVTHDKGKIVELVSGLVCGAVGSVLLIVFSWTYMWQSSVVITAGYVIYAVALMAWGFRNLHVPGMEVPVKVYQMPRRRPMVDAEPMPELPKPVYGAARASPKDSRL